MAHPVDAHVGQRLRHRRWMMGLTQQQLAALVGVRFQQIQKYESGVNRVSASRLWDLSQALSVSVAFFFDGLEEEEGKPASTDISPPAEDVMEERETVELVRSYYGIETESRRYLLDLIKSLSTERDDRVA